MLSHIILLMLLVVLITAVRDCYRKGIDNCRSGYFIPQVLKAKNITLCRKVAEFSKILLTFLFVFLVLLRSAWFYFVIKIRSGGINNNHN
ncbi:hypothetical protein, partial [Cronobacter sakazakii]|uniref:hypothetical protein n=1 Tax=Cronobacter sakazakii TaxID=28141 RepID=UPI001F43D514